MRITDSSYSKGLLWGLFSLLSLGNAMAQKNLPFKKGEILNYELVYQWGIIWVEAGMATFSVADTVSGGQTYFKFKGYGQSYTHWDWFYKVRSTYESYADANLQSKRFLRYGQEGSRQYNRDYHVKSDSIFYKIADDKKEIRHGSLPTMKDAYDVITAIYHCRTLDFSMMTVESKIPLTFYLDGAYHPSYLRYKGKTIWKDPRDDKEYACYLFKPALIEGTIFKAGENMEVYVTADYRRIPIYIETELSVGKARIFLM